MSGSDEERDMLAAEYALGSMDAEQADEFRARLRGDPAMARAARAWEAKLAPLALLAEPAAPWPGLWEGIAAELGIAAPDTMSRPALRATAPVLPGERRRPAIPARRGAWARIWRDADVWRLAALLALTVGIGGAAYGLRPRAPSSPMAVATLTAPGTFDPVATAELTGDGGIVVRPLHAVPVPGGHSLALWALPLGSTAPVLLGAIPAEGGRMPAPRLAGGSQVMVTLEPAGGPVPGGAPGRPLFAGVVTEVPRQGG